MSEKRTRNYEVQCLLQLLEAIVNKKDVPKWKRKPQWGNLYKLADYHGVANTIYYMLIAKSDPELLSWKVKFEDRFHEAVLAEERYSVAVPELLAAFEANQIHAIVLQEFRMRLYYPHYDMRALKSVTIQVEKGKEEVLQNVLHSLDYEQKESRLEDESWYYKVPEIKIIIRTEPQFTNKKMKKYFTTSVKSYPRLSDKKYIHAFDPEDYYIYVIGCAGESYARGRLDIRGIMDIWLYYLKEYEQLDWKVINKKLEQLKLDQFHVYLIQLAAYWFDGMLFPENDQVFDAMEQYILSKGVKGRKVSATLLPLVKEVADFYAKDLRRKRREQIMDWLFPDMDYMSTMFPILHRVRFLLPLCWGLRLIRLGWQQLCVFGDKKTYKFREAVKVQLQKIKQKLQAAGKKCLDKMKKIFGKVKEQFRKNP